MRRRRNAWFCPSAPVSCSRCCRSHEAYPRSEQAGTGRPTSICDAFSRPPIQRLIPAFNSSGSRISWKPPFFPGMPKQPNVSSTRSSASRLRSPVPWVETMLYYGKALLAAACRRRTVILARSWTRGEEVAILARTSSAGLWRVAAPPAQARRLRGLRCVRGRDIFDALGASPWSDRAREELRASGEASRRRTEHAWEALTPQELHIAQLAAEGLSNKEIGARLYLSHRTVGYHLHRIFSKTGITSRSGLHAPSLPTRHTARLTADPSSDWSFDRDAASLLGGYFGGCVQPPRRMIREARLPRSLTLSLGASLMIQPAQAAPNAATDPRIDPAGSRFPCRRSTRTRARSGNSPSRNPRRS